MSAKAHRSSRTFRADGMGGVGFENLAGDEPVEEHPGAPPSAVSPWAATRAPAVALHFSGSSSICGLLVAKQGKESSA